MDITPQLERLLRQIIREEMQRLRNDLARLRQELFKSNNKDAWATAADVIKLTGWNSEQLRRHRDQDTIVYKVIGTTTDGKKNYRYNLNSIPEQYIKQ